MRTRWLLAGVAGIILIAGVGLVVRSSHPGSKQAPVTIASVTRAFAARGIALEPELDAGVAPGVKAHPLGILWNGSRASREGVVSVIVLPSVAQAKLVNAQHMPPTARDVCGGLPAADHRQWQAGNIVATFSRCNYTKQPFHEAATPASSAVDAVMRIVAG